jgi:sec-independent protein translocase protein TatA
VFGLGSQELLVILIIVVILFGANRLPQIARSLGSSMKEFKKGIDEDAAVSTERPCRSCQNPLAADWSHCPRCGTPVAQGPAIPPRG